MNDETCVTELETSFNYVTFFVYAKILATDFSAKLTYLMTLALTPVTIKYVFYLMFLQVMLGFCMSVIYTIIITIFRNSQSKLLASKYVYFASPAPFCIFVYDT